MAVDDDAKLQPEPVRVPAMIFALHDLPLQLARSAGSREYASLGAIGATELRTREPVAPMYTAVTQSCAGAQGLWPLRLRAAQVQSVFFRC
jgi:hypothetical protein